MISHKYKCIFIDVPKTGSTSIRAVLGSRFIPHQDLWQTKHEMETSWTHYGGPINRILASLYLLLPGETRKRIGNRQFNSYFIFGFVRNPWDRVVSLYERREGLQLRNQLTFEQFVDWLKFSSGTCVHPSPHRNQLDWFVDPHGRVLADFIGNFDNLESDWELIARKLKISQALPHKNKNPRREKHYTEYYTPKTRQLVAERFKVDIEYFGFEFGSVSRVALMPNIRRGMEPHIPATVSAEASLVCASRDL